MMNEHDFALLLQRVREGSEDAAWTLFEQYNQQILRIVRRRLPKELRGKFDSMDFTQNTWASFFAQRSYFPNFEEPKQFVAYVGTIAANKIGIEIRRRIKGRKYSVLGERSLATCESAPKAHGVLPRPSEVAIANECWSRLLREKSQYHQEMIRMRLAGHTFREIAEELGFDERTVRRVMDRAAREIRRE